MFDAFLDWVVVFLPLLLSIGSVIVSIKTPHSKHHRRWYGGLVLAGLSISGLTFWQQLRSRSAHATEVGTLNTKLGTLGANLKTLQANVDSLTQQQNIEIARRQQAQADLTLIIQATGKSTREGVASDIRNSPIKVDMSGQPLSDPVKTLAVRNRLAQFIERSDVLKNKCVATTLPLFPCVAETDKWYEEALQYISQNMEGSYRARFVSATGPWISMYGANEAVTRAVNEMTYKVRALAEFIKEMH